MKMQNTIMKFLKKFEFDFIKWINTKYKKLESLQNKKKHLDFICQKIKYLY